MTANLFHTYMASSLTNWNITFNGYVFILFLFVSLLTILLFRKYYSIHWKTDCRHLNKRLSPCPIYESSYKEILQSLKDQEFLVNFSNYINSPGPFSNKLQKNLHILGIYTKVDRISIFEDFQLGKMAKNTFEWCKPDILPERENYQVVAYRNDAVQWKEQLMKDGALHSSSLNGLPFEDNNVNKPGLNKSIFTFPLYVHHNFYGFIAFENIELFNWDIGFLKTISTIISNAFERFFSEEEIKNSESKFRDLFNHSSDAIFIFNYQGQLIEVNTPACETLELPKEEILYKNISFFFPEDHVPHDKLYNLNPDRSVQVFESEFCTPAGKVFTVEVSSRHITFNNHNAVLCVTRDISKRKEMQREILSAIIQTEEKERGRIAQDLHDGLGPLLSSLKLYVKVIGTTENSEKRELMLKTTHEVIDESMILIKEISNNLSPHVLDDFGLASAIQSFCKKITFTKEIEIKFDSNVFDQRFERNVEIVLFRVLKELVNNTIKHALASRIEIFLLRTENILSLVYSDNGIGFDFKKVLDNKNSGMGISNIVNRLNSVNGRFMFESQSGRGIQIKMEVGLKNCKH